METPSLVSAVVKNSAFANSKATKSIRVCCFGSSSSQTPEAYTRPSADVGYLLGVRGHVCVNGAGSYGCMGAMNDGALEGNGHILGVTHEMWIKVGEDSRRWGLHRPLRDTGAHPAFANSVPKYHGSIEAPRYHNDSQHEPIRELLVATGTDLQERKKLLIGNSDALIVMPGGPGTFDELWEMACARNLGLSTIPLVCVNTDGFYDSFRAMLERAWDDKLTKLPPEQIMHFADTPEEAIRWVEQILKNPNYHESYPKKPSKEMLRYTSALGNVSITATAFNPTGRLEMSQIVAMLFIFAIGFVSGGVVLKQYWAYDE